ncbi:MAG: hypothetical protein D6736_09810 [Nitrospinota bacterium]|nr:MAG: hypothetical protein D6736_09810 [Nitrospinota bacterium]
MSSLSLRVENIVRTYAKQLRLNKLGGARKAKEGAESDSDDVRVSISAEGKQKQIQSQIASQLADELARQHHHQQS